MLGTYSFDKNGDTTLTDYGIYKVGPTANPTFDKTVKAQRSLGSRRRRGGRRARPAARSPYDSIHMEASIQAPPPPAALSAAPGRVRAFAQQVRADPRPAGAAGRLRRSRTSATTATSPASANNLFDGLSNGAIWALIAIGYTLVYGIIELINFAHGDVFMIGSFVAVGSSGARSASTLGHRRRSGIVLGLLVVAHRRDGRLRRAERDDRAGRLPAVAQRAQARAADHRGRLLVHPAERRPAVARRLAGRASTTSSTPSRSCSRSSASHDHARRRARLRGDDPAGDRC